MLLPSILTLLLIMVTGVVMNPLPLEEEEECDKEYSCINCTTVKVCAANWNSTLTKRLEFQCDSSAPFCHYATGTCSSVAEHERCAPYEEDFICGADGFYPHPTNCRKYYVCIKGYAYLQDCGGTYYNAVSEKCSGSSCTKIHCQGQSGVKKAHDGTSKYFGYCLDGLTVRVDKCPGQLELDDEQQICVPRCNGEGQQGDPFDCTRYYVCAINNTQYTINLFHKQCPEGELYDALNNHCTPKRIGLTCESGDVYTGDD